MRRTVMKKRILISAVCALFILAGCANTGADDLSIELTADEITDAPSVSPASIVVYICGEVKNPGVYTLEETARIGDLLEAAGGPLETADLTKINLAGKLSDGQQIIVKAGSKIEAGEGNEEGSEDGSGRVNLNFADREELMTLPGIGEAKADAILAYREEIGWFSSTEELMNITGIKEKMYQKIADLIEV